MTIASELGPRVVLVWPVASIWPDAEIARAELAAATAPPPEKHVKNKLTLDPALRDWEQLKDSVEVTEATAALRELLPRVAGEEARLTASAQRRIGAALSLLSRRGRETAEATVAAQVSE